MHDPHGHHIRTFRRALAVALFATGFALLPAAASGHGYWHLTVPPEELLRWRPRDAAELVHGPRASAVASRAVAPAPAAATTTGTAVWSVLAGPGVRYLHDSVLDEATGRIVIFGGMTYPDAPMPLAMACAPGATSGWEPLGAGSAGSPVARFTGAVAIDPVRHALLVFGGQALDGSGEILGDLWSLSLEPGGTWTRLEPAGPSPAPRRFASLFFDAPRGRFVLAGGSGEREFAEFWELRLAPAPEWRPLVFDNPAGARLGATLADPVRGDAWSVAWANEIHHLALGADTVAAGPAIFVEPDSSRWGPPTLLLAAFDAFERRLLWFGYQAGGPSRAHTDEAWWFPLDGTGGLVPQPVDGARPADRYLFASTWDPGGQRLLVTGGYDDDLAYFGDAWQLAVPPMAPTPVTASLRLAESDARGVRFAWLVPEAAGARATVQRTADGVAWAEAGEAWRTSADEVTWEGPPLEPREHAGFRLVLASGTNVTRTAPAWVAGPDAGALTLAPRRGPAGPDLALAFTLATGEPAHLRVFDAVGRVVAEARVPAGAREWSFGRAAAPGLYFAELTQGSERRVAKLVTLR